MFDQSTDLNGQQLYALLKLHVPPQFVKTASQEAVVGDANLPNHVFADPGRRMFPCHTAPATWVSALLFNSQEPALDKRAAAVMGARIDKAAKYHGIGSMICELKEAIVKNSQHTENDLADSEFALVFTDDKGNKDRRYPLRNAEEIKTAASYLRKYKHDFVYDDRRLMAERVLAKAAEHNVELEDRSWFAKVAGHGFCSAEDAAGAIVDRLGRIRAGKHAGRSLDVQEKLAEAAKTCLDNPASARRPESLQSLARMLDQVDREFHIKKAAAIEDVLFALDNDKLASAASEHVAMTSGSIYGKGDLSRLSVEDLRDVMGDAFVDSVSNGVHVDTEKLAEVAATLPRSDAELFDKLMAEIKIKPAFKTAAVRQRLSLEELAELAAVG